jgi:hypothetical protein
VLHLLVVAAALSGLSSRVSAQAAPTSASTTCEAEAIAHSTGDATPDGWNIWSTGYISTQHDFVGGETTVTVIARGEPLGGVWPIMTVSLGGTAVASQTVASATWRSYTFSIDPQPGQREIRVSFENDDRNDTEDRNLLVDKFTIACGSSSTTSVPTDPIAFPKRQRHPARQRHHALGAHSCHV